MRKLLLLSISILALGGCGRLSGTFSKYFGPIHETEPNDHFTEANLIPLNCKVVGTMHSADDIDMFRLEPTQDGVLSVHVGGIREMDFVIDILDKDRQELKRFDETGVGGDEDAMDVGLHPGTYYLQLTNKNPKANNPNQEYAMTVKTESSAGREMEPNDTALTAQLIAPGGVLRGHYFPSQNLLAADKDFAEEDWYKIHVANAGQYVLNIDVSEVPKIQPILEIYDANSYKIKEVDADEPGAAVSLKNLGIRGPADYLLRLRSRAAHAGNSDVPYELLTELVPYDGRTEFEPNDQRLDSTEFKGDSITGTIAPEGDVDWYKIIVDTDTKQLLGAEVSGVPNMDLVMKLADEVGNTIVTIDNMGKEQPEVLTGMGVKKGAYYLVISEKSGKKADARHPYTLTKTLIPWQPGLEYEPNDTAQSAQPIKLGESVDGYLAPKGDIDWYQFNVYQQGRAVVELTGVLNVQFVATLLDQDSKELATVTGKKAGDSLSIEKDLQPGTYFVRLKAADGEQNNVRDKYTLRLKMR